MLVMCFMMVFVVIMLHMIYFHIVFFWGGPGRTNNSSTWLRNKGLGYLDGLNEPDVT